MSDALLQSATRAHQAGDIVGAARAYGEILRREPSHFDALYGLGVLHYQTGVFAEAERFLKRATERNPRLPEPWYLLGGALYRSGHAEEALAAFDRAIALKPAYPEALTNKGAILMGMRRHAEALATFDAALAANRSMAEAWNNRGNALCELARYEEAVTSYAQGLRIRRSAEALINNGTALIALGQFERATASYDEAIRINPALAQAHAGLANALYRQKLYTEAAFAYAHALDLDCELDYALGNLAYCNLYCCNWRTLPGERANIAAALNAGKRTVNPFQSLALLDNETAQLRATEIWSADKLPAIPVHAPGSMRAQHEKIRIAYLSTDFNEHAVGVQMAGVFERHNRRRFETIAVSLGASYETPMRARLKGAFDQFIDAERMSDAQVAEQLRGMDIDIAVDLMGFTGDYRMGILSSRPAAVQVNYLGFPGTMGARHIDYIIADRVVIPQASRTHYSEAVVYLPDCYLPNDATRAIAERKPSRSEAGLPQDAIVFACFNNSYKLTPEVFAVWMRLLRAVEESVLWLAEPNAVAAANLRKEVQDAGVAPERIVFAPLLPRPEEHLARLTLADLFLDTLPYNAHSTACDALWAGLPVLTCMGSSFASRVGASLLNAVGLPDLITYSLAEYEARALGFARDPLRFAALKARLAVNRDTYPLFYTARSTRSLESAYAAMHERAIRGEAPQSFAVAES